ncbi:transcriptional regulator [Chromobacterium haemolyticum]|uniref:transcriptional regulator n=1 Tax=Chromobacterium haemolyticum TaxID=394935 RepID=UPI0009D953E3|nr:transcriptional regulator [Chromobacterium haemolyticum]OQS28260.1 transcriptional regulator [Chromobacterium haemolyticum]PTU69378.1 transcriptional regulator [Chromobacterium haemolyticum]
MYTLAETSIFTRYVADYWSEEERSDFFVWLVNNPTAGAVIPGSGGCRKVRWSSEGQGKRGGVRVIYYNLLDDGTIWLLTIYGKNVREDIPAHILRAIKETIDAD